MLLLLLSPPCYVDGPISYVVVSAPKCDVVAHMCCCCYCSYRCVVVVVLACFVVIRLLVFVL